LEKGISWEVIWFDFDQNLIEIAFACSNGYFCGTCEIYLSRDELADALHGFPSSGSDNRSVELGTFDPKYADCGVRMNFYCSDSRGHSIAEIKLRGDGCKVLGEVESSLSEFQSNRQVWILFLRRSLLLSLRSERRRFYRWRRKRSQLTASSRMASNVCRLYVRVDVTPDYRKHPSGPWMPQQPNETYDGSAPTRTHQAEALGLAGAPDG